MKSVMEKNLGKTWPWVLGFLVGLSILYLYWMVNVPMTNAPDEAVRIILSDYVWRHGRLPNAWEPSVRIYNWGFSYALRPMLVNIIGAGFMAITSLFTTDLWALVLSVRLVSVISGVLMALYCFKIGIALGWQERWVWVFACICSLMPQIVFLSSYNNNDIFSLFCTTMIIFYWIRGLQTRWDWQTCITLAVVLGLTCLSYYNAYPFVLFSVVIFFASQIHRHMEKEEWKQLFIKAGAVTLITFVLAGWWFIRNIILYDGDMLGTETRLQMGRMFALEELKPDVINNPINAGESFIGMLFNTQRLGGNWFSFTFKSTIGYLGCMEYDMPNYIYKTMFWFWMIGGAGFVIGWFVRLFSRRGTEDGPKETRKNQVLFTFCLVASMLLVVFLSMYYSWSDDYQPQGRYLIPAFTAIIFVVAAGWRWIIQSVGSLVHSKVIFPRIAAVIICISMAALQFYALFTIILPNFQGQPRMPEYYEAQYWLYQQ